MMSSHETDIINGHVLDRLMQYYHCIHDRFDPKTHSIVSSAHIARVLALDDSQIRKDLAAIGVKGHCRVGFNIQQVIDTIQKTLGIMEHHPAIVIGAGRLGAAISSYQGFADYGLKVVALFDVDTGKIGLELGGHIVQPLKRLGPVVRQANVRLGILTVPVDAAQESVDRLVRAGIKVIWNFTPGPLNVPENVFVRHERLFVALAQLFYNLKRAEPHTSLSADAWNST